MRDPLYAMRERRRNWMNLSFLVWLVFFLAGYAAAVASGESAHQALQFGASLMVWGGALRTVLVWHTTWSVNSVTQIWGYRNYETPDETPDDSRNNPIIGIITGGEGWHNNHDADPTSARHGHHWWELDFAWWVVRLLVSLGLATKVALPSPDLGAKFAVARPTPASTKDLDQ
jgi:stearoyl-CoA desaturase (delta-9 desaturase)